MSERTTRTLPLTALIVEQDAMVSVLESGRISDTPDEPIYVCARVDMPGRYEISDGLHRVAAAIRAGRSEIRADVNPDPDDEPYEKPFYDFSTV